MRYLFKIFFLWQLLLPLSPYTPQQKILLGYKMDINEMTAADWESLPKIGPGLAKKIASHRERFGPFQTTEDLKQVGGIGEKTLDLVRPYLETPVSKK